MNNSPEVKMIDLIWDDDEGEGKIKVQAKFEKANDVVQIDSLNDWILQLTELRDKLLSLQRPDIRTMLWGK